MASNQIYTVKGIKLDRATVSYWAVGKIDKKSPYILTKLKWSKLYNALISLIFSLTYLITEEMSSLD